MVTNAGMYGYNPYGTGMNYGMTNTGMYNYGMPSYTGTSVFGDTTNQMGFSTSDDFMYNATMPVQTQQTYMPTQQQITPEMMAQYQQAQQGQESSEGGINPLTAGVVGGLGVTAGTYYFGNKFGSQITKDGKTFADSILKAADGDAKVLTGTGLEAGTLAKNSEALATLTERKGLIEGLADNATSTQFKEIVTQNPKAFGITATAAEEIATKADDIAKGFTSKATALEAIAPEIEAATKAVDTTKTTLNTAVASHWDDAAKAFKSEAPEALTKAGKSFKWGKAIKYGLIAAAVVGVACWLFGKKNDKQS